MSKQAGILLAMMEGLAGSLDISLERPRPSPIMIVRQGNLNKICSGCGHKNKKCTCEQPKAKETSDE